MLRLNVKFLEQITPLLLVMTLAALGCRRGALLASAARLPLTCASVHYDDVGDVKGVVAVVAVVAGIVAHDA